MDHPQKTKIFYFITKGNFGGAQRYVFEMAKNLPKNNFDITVIMGEGRELREKLNRLGIRTIQLETLVRDIKIVADWKTFRLLFRIISQEKPDILHLNSSKAGGLGAFAGRLAKVPKIIFTIHGLAFNENRPSWQKHLIKLGHWLSIILCHQVIVVAESLKKQIESWPRVKKKIIVIHNGLDTVKFFNRFVARNELLNYFPPEIRQLKNKNVASQNMQTKFWIGTVSELHKNKGLDILIEAFAGTVKSMLGSSIGWSLVLVIIGDGDEKASLQKLIRDKRLEDRIFLLGRIPDARNYLNALDIFTLTSRTEALPYTILEAGAAGLPVVASDVGGISEIIPEPEYGILVPPGNVKEIEKSLLYLIKKPEYRKLAGANLKKRIQENFSIKKMVTETVGLYQK